MRLSLMLGLVAALVSATVAFSAAAAEQLPVSQFGSTGSGAGQMRAPGGVAVDLTSGDVYVADTGNNRIEKFSPTGSHLLTWGWGVKDGKSELETCTAPCEQGYGGNGAGQLNEVVGVAVDPTNGDVYALNRRGGFIQRFTASGAFLESFGGYGAAANQLGSQVAALNAIAVDPSGNVYVGDPFKFRIAKFDSSGTFVGALSGESGPLAIDAAGDLYVATTGSETVHIYKPDGSLKGELSLHESFGARAVAINPANGNLIAEVTSGFEASTTYALKEINAANELVATSPLDLAPPPSGFEPLSFGLAAGAAANFPEHEPGAVYVSDLIKDHVQVLAEGLPAQPRIEGLEVGALGTDYADVAAALNPRGLATEYFVDWGPTAAYGNVSPASPGQLAAGFGAKAVGIHLNGLVPGATYHFKLVATNVDGTTESTDQAFTTYAVGGPLGLPDGRAYEMVSPVEKGNNDVEDRGGVEERGVAGTGESGIAYTTINGLPGSPAGALAVGNIAQRGPTGWTSTAVSPEDINQFSIATASPVMMSNDLTKALVGSRVDLTGNAPAGLNLFIRTLSPPSYELVTPEASGGLFAYEPRNAVGASNDFSHVFFQAFAKLTPESPEALFRPNLYEWDGSQLRNVGILPNETAPAPEGVTAYEPELRPVSESGASVIFGAEDGAQNQVFRREGGQTVEVSAPNPGVVDPKAFPATFVGAAADGSSVFFTSRRTLTDDAYTGETSGGETDLAPNLYRYDVASGALTDLTIDETGERGAAVGRVVVAASGQAAYFVAEGTFGNAEAILGSPNLYRWSQGGGVEFIATLSPADAIVSGPEAPEAVTDESGDAVAFVSSAGLAGRTGAAGIAEIYHWSTSEGLACASCGSGLMRTGATMPAPGLKLGSGGGKPLSADGTKVFFTTSDALVTADTNGKQDAYEWEGGADRLLSTGTGNSNSYFVDASPSGKDVFFATRDRLVPADRDENTDVYDAREGGGFPAAAPEPNPCEAEACRPPQVAAPLAPQLGSRNFNGPGNRKPARKKPHKHKKKQARHKQHHKQKSKARPAGKRG